MTTLIRALLTTSLLLAFAAPVAAEEVSPEPVLYAAPVTAEAPIESAEEAVAAIVASGAPFADFVAADAGLIGASQTYTASGDAMSSWTIVFSYGWGDCQAGCIDSRSFTYTVDAASGDVTFTGNAGEALPADAPEALRMLVAMSESTPVVISEPVETTTTDATFWWWIGGGAMLIAMSLGWVVIERRKRGE